LHEGVFGGIQGAMCVEDAEELGLAFGIEFGGKLDGLAICGYGIDESDISLVLFGVCNQGIFDVLNCGQDGFFIIEEGLLLEGLLNFDI